MLANTGTLSLVLYGFFLLLTITAMFVAIYFIKNGSIENEKLDKMIDLFKYAIVSTAIATVAFIITDLFKEREQDVKELEYFDKYVDDVKKVDGIQERMQLSKYLSVVAPSGEMKKSWENYYKIVLLEYDEYLNSKKEQKEIDASLNPTVDQLIRKEELQQKIDIFEKPLSTPQNQGKVVTNDRTAAKNWEEKGFNYLLEKDVGNAIDAFINSENSYNQYHQVYEISRYLSKNRSLLKDPNSLKWKDAYLKIARDLSYGIPAASKKEFLERSNQ